MGKENGNREREEKKRGGGGVKKSHHSVNRLLEVFFDHSPWKYFKTKLEFGQVRF